MAFKCITSFRQFIQYLQYHPSIPKYCGLAKIPCRHTLVRRMKQLSNTLETIIEFNGRYFIEKGYCNPKDIAVDCKAFKGRKGDKQRSLLRTNYGWVRGYGGTFNIPTIPIRGKKLACAFLTLLVVAYQILIWINIQQGSKQIYRIKNLISIL